MKCIFTSCLLLSIWLMFSTSAYAQQPDDDLTYEYAHNTANYQYNHEYHYEHGQYGYRHEAKMLDSLSVLEMMNSLTREEVEEQWEAFQEKKKEAKKKKDKKRKKRKKDKKKRKLRDQRQSFLYNSSSPIADSRFTLFTYFY